MGLAISLVAMEKEKVWYHVCANRGRGCYNTRLKEDGGCTIWYKEKELLSDIEEHLKCTVTQCEPDIKVVTTRVTWMLWHQRSWNWLTSRGKPNLPSSTWDTCQTRGVSQCRGRFLGSTCLPSHFLQKLGKNPSWHSENEEWNRRASVQVCVI
ncbi:uncharacterized protein LOC117493518 isoform X1 [Trematomus bernacchii]|uniref:uncharacterized protein LOC117493518 isoform X1 n=1 Tax=Trematomus bernacchii TaxID=40690 RepID=UPI00146ACDB1|nr:uncharacterized protein LOC117493518 isoform X1 [Trematomus bernacchii]XP_034000009.1 uncharacterized protein LOC117493518 isoform X1 [Trematomus bernacchii]XP_034000010.1 uncharacterized protein LOC117493518 isoform X1 [Trematomus bernacchii]